MRDASIAGRFILGSLLLGVTISPAVVADRGTVEEAKTMLAKAVSHYKAVGRKQALADFTAQIPPFRDRDLYIVCFNRQLLVSANGGFPSNVDTSADLVKAANGGGVGTLAWKLTEATGEAIVRYRWVNPSSRQLEWKLGFFVRLSDDVCGVGVYGGE